MFCASQNPALRGTPIGRKPAPPQKTKTNERNEKQRRTSQKRRHVQEINSTDNKIHTDSVWNNIDTHGTSQLQVTG